MTCEYCRFFKNKLNGTGEGECRRNPPQTSLLTRLLWNEKKTRIFPIVYTDDWCGEGRKKEYKL